ncbi:MAG: hypothetical protein KDA75_04660 [Planctomycetaceae bacterium]|nr:hypothetical protein [Planctomycetaceae bacterium]
MSTDDLTKQWEHWHAEGSRLAGELEDLQQRASVYRYLFLASGGNHAFPLIAAHGALWAGGYFRFGLGLGRALSWMYVGSPQRRRTQLDSLEQFADVFRDINRRVCVDTYANFHFTRLYGQNPDAARLVDPELLPALNAVHAAAAAQRVLSDEDKRTIFKAHFLHEQRHVVGPTLTAAVQGFQWPLVKAIALRPPVRFAYFPGQTRLWFRNFASQDERIAKGLQAFSIAAAVGWAKVDAALECYGVLSPEFFIHPGRYFAELRKSLLTGGMS